MTEIDTLKYKLDAPVIFQDVYGTAETPQYPNVPEGAESWAYLLLDYWTGSWLTSSHIAIFDCAKFYYVEVTKSNHDLMPCYLKLSKSYFP